MGEILERNVENLPVDIVFQDEARFGRLSDPRRSWAPAPHRPVVMTCLVRQFNYVFGAVCPSTGQFDYMRAKDMKTPNMSKFLKRVSTNHNGKFVVMVLDGASTHKAKTLEIPSNVGLIILPPYSP